MKYPFPEIIEQMEVEALLHKCEDGLDKAWHDGFNLILDELKYQWDGGISESYFNGIKAALKMVEGSKQ